MLVISNLILLMLRKQQRATDTNKLGKQGAKFLNTSPGRHNEKSTPLPDEYDHIALISETRQ